MPHGITATFNFREGMSIVKRVSVAGQHFDQIVLKRLVQQVAGEIMNAAFTGDTSCLDDHAMISRTRIRNTSMPASVVARLASCPTSFPAFARLVS